MTTKRTGPNPKDVKKALANLKRELEAPAVASVLADKGSADLFRLCTGCASNPCRCADSDVDYLL